MNESTKENAKRLEVYLIAKEKVIEKQIRSDLGFDVIDLHHAHQELHRKGIIIKRSIEADANEDCWYTL